MFTSGHDELVRLRRADLIREARHDGLVRAARGLRTSRSRRLLVLALRAAARRIEPMAARVAPDAAGLRPEPCAASPC
jgi:hypothetical protein